MEKYAYQPRTAALVESFDTVRDLRPSDVPEGASGVGPVDWPAECPGLKTALGAFYAAATTLVEQTVARNGRPAHVVTHSLGGPTALAFLQRQSDTWLRAHVANLITIAAPWVGAVRASP